MDKKRVWKPQDWRKRVACATGSCKKRLDPAADSRCPGCQQGSGERVDLPPDRQRHRARVRGAIQSDRCEADSEGAAVEQPEAVERTEQRAEAAIERWRTETWPVLPKKLRKKAGR
jgi:hypothetical protein